MSYQGDKAREERHAATGGVRLHARIGRDAAEALDYLCAVQRLEKRQVLERLILDAAPAFRQSLGTTDKIRQREDALMLEFGVSRAQARDAIERGTA